jgi:hypothetical protein
MLTRSANLWLISGESMGIDSAGKTALALMKTEGTGFLASGIRMKHLVKDLEIEGAAKKPEYGRTVGRYMSTEAAEK